MKKIRVVTTTHILITALAVFLIGTKPWAAASAEMLDGKVFVGEVGLKGKKAGEKDEIIFRDGKFHSAGCDPYGFGDGTYTATPHGDAVVFHTATESPTDGKIEWKGIVKGSILEGTFIWHRPHKWYHISNTPKEYWIKAELKQ